MRVIVALAVALGLLAAALSLVLAQHPLEVLATSGVQEKSELTSAHGGARVCQGSEVIPRGTSAVRVSLGAPTLGPRIALQARSSEGVVFEGSKAAGWRGGNITIPLHRVLHGTSLASLCLTLGASREDVTVFGGKVPGAAPARSGTRVLDGRVIVEYLGSARGSWWSRGLTVARHLGLGHALGGSWIALLLAGLMLAMAGLAAWLIVRELSGSRLGVDERPRVPARLALLRRLPLAAWVCAIVACLNAAGWSLITPLFQASDEQDHFAYVQQLAETGSLPTPNSESRYSLEQELAMRDLRYQAQRNVSDGHEITSLEEQHRLMANLATHPARRGSGDAGTADPEPPLYYALETIPYAIGWGGSILVRMELMRLLSALMGGLTALFVFLFVRELLPGARWAWTVGGLGAALAPLPAFNSGAITPDALLATLCAASFYLLARGFHRGLTPRLAGSMAAVAVLGFLTKLTFVALLPGLVAGLGVLMARAGRRSQREAPRRARLVGALGIGPIVLYALVGLLVKHSALGISSGALDRVLGHRSLLSAVSYVWQRHLPRLPWMAVDLPGVSPWREVWFDGVVGQYGWSVISFSDRVNELALIPAFAIVALALLALVRLRSRLRGRALEGLVYLVMVVGVLALLGAAGYISYPIGALSFRAPRYLLPLLALAGGLLALAARGGGRRQGPVLGTLIVVLMLAHDLFSQLLVISRVYGLF